LKTIPNSPTHAAIVRLAFLLIPFAVAASVTAQSPEQPEPPSVNRIIINFTGLSNVNEEVALANMSLREGEAYDPIVVDRDIRSLYRSSLFEYIEARVAPAGEGLVDVIFDIRPKFRISALLFEGNDKVSDRKLEREISIVVNQTLNEPRVKSASEDIQELYLKRGFSQVRVDYRIDRSPVTGFATVTFQISEGRKFKIKSLQFAGNENLKRRKLKRAMDTKRWSFFSVFTGKGRFDRDVFEDDLESLKDVYREEGFLDIEVDPTKVQFSYPSENRMRIDIAVEEGKQYRIGNIDFVGNEIYEDSVLQLMLRSTPGSVYRPAKLDEDVQRLEDFYGRFGYMESRVRMVRVPNVESGDIDLQYMVNESEQFQVESIDIEGNTKTKSVVVLRELALTPGSSFDSTRMEASRMRLENTRYFEDTNVTPQSTNVPGRKDVRITFKEGRTGNFSFGAGFSSLEQGVFFVELSQSNFDVLNWRGAFQGDGQKFRLKAQIGGRSSSITLSFEEPWLFEKRLAFGFNIFNQTSDFESVSYESEVRGFDVYLRRRLIELIEGRVTYSFREQTFNFPENAPEADRLRESEGSISNVNLLLLRDTRDRLINSLRGMRLELDLDFAGDFLGGDFDFYKLESRNAFYLPLSEKFTQTVEFLVRLGIADELEENPESPLPFQERFFLGGPNTLRGFEFNDVSPKEFGFIRANQLGVPPASIGGKTYGLFSAEYSIGLTKDFRLAAFYDGGFVNKETGDFSLDRDKVFIFQEGYSGGIFGPPTDGPIFTGQRRSGWNDNYGFGIRMSMAGTPLRLDYALPITTDGHPNNGGNDNGGQFNFTFGGRF